MSKELVRKIVLVLMIVAVVVGIVYIFKSRTPKNEYRTSVTFENTTNYTEQTYSEPRIEENMIEYAHRNYLPIILTSFGAFVLLLVFYAFLSKKKGW